MAKAYSKLLSEKSTVEWFIAIDSLTKYTIHIKVCHKDTPIPQIDKTTTINPNLTHYYH